MAISAIITQSTQFGGAGGTTSGIDTTGADLIVVALCYFNPGGPNISDSKGNTWTALNTYNSGNSSVRMYYCSNPAVGSGHTFTTTSTFCGVNIIAVSGARTASTPADQQNGDANTGSSNPQTTGSITPSVNGCLVVTSFYQATAGSAPTIPSGYTSVGTWPTSTAFLGGCAYKIQSSASAENPGWTPGNAGFTFAANIADFMPPAAAVTSHNLTLLGTGT